MTDDEKRVIETQLALKEKALALKERQHDLEAKKFRLLGATIGTIVLLTLCFLAVFFGGIGIMFMNVDTYIAKQNTDTKSSPAQIENGAPKKPHSPTSASSGCVPIINAPVYNNNTIGSSQSGVTEKEFSPYLPITVLMILKGLLVFAGLGIAAYTVRIIAHTNNDD